MATCSQVFNRKPVAQALCVALALFAVHAHAEYTSTNRDVLVPNTGIWSADGVTLGGTNFKVLGLQGVGRVAASTKDPVTGESLGSISDLQITGFHSTGAGSYAGTFNFLPDRGYNSGAIYSNYAARINSFDFSFTPWTSNGVTTAQNQIQMTFNGSSRFTYDHDGNAATAPIYTTGLLPTSSATTLFGVKVPTVSASVTQSDGSFSNRLTLDTEGLVLDPRAGKAGSGWVSDEYGAFIYHFDANKVIDGQLELPEAMVTHNAGGADDFVVGQASGTQLNGRRINQGMEGIALSPDGSKLFGLLQSATIQDSGAGNQGRSNARLVVYDVTGSDLPNDPSAQYVIQLPRIDDTGSTTNGTSVNRTGAQSAIVALNDHQLLILARDGNGRGASGSPVFKSVLLADLNGATNIDGLYDATGAQTAPSGTLLPSITPVAWTEALNMLGKLDLGVSELEQFGLNTNAAPGNTNSLSEKWEGLGLVPVGDGSNDYFLFVGNDNDFISASGAYMDANGVLQTYNSGLENDTLVLAYRVSATPVPLPAAAWLMASGAAGLLGWARRRRS
ncbi:MAG: esterase-like activity of phytase family protein [Burkholderiales bacterium]